MKTKEMRDATDKAAEHGTRYLENLNELVEEAMVSEDDWALGPACSTEHEECESCQ